MKRKIHALVLIFLLLLYILVTGMISAKGQTAGCSIQFDSTVTNIDGRTNAKSVKPGDTICLLKGSRPVLYIGYIHGTKEHPVVIMNSGGQVSIVNCTNYGVKFDSCSYLVFTGSGSPEHTYGIRINQTVGAGLSLDGLSTDIELSYLMIGNTGLVGIFAKTEPNCLFNSTREKFTLRNLNIHHCYIYATGMEGMYIGSSKYKGQTINCNGKDTTVYPHMLRGVEVHHNYMMNTGWDGIQVSSADSACAVHDNLVVNDSHLEVLYQMSGILIGGGTQADCYNNTITDGKGDGIDVISFGTQRLYNNLIVNAGRTFRPGQNVAPWLKFGIYLGGEFTASGNKNIVVNNTIVSPKSYCIETRDNLSTVNEFSNNILLNPGSYPGAGDKAYISIGSGSPPITMNSNIKTLDINALDFVDAPAGNYDLRKSSPAVNAASDVEGFSLAFDLSNRSRPFSIKNDIGAFECHDSSLLAIYAPDPGGITRIEASPNPASGKLNISFSAQRAGEAIMVLINLKGIKVYSQKVPFNKPGRVTRVIDVESLPSGMYTVSVITVQAVSSAKVMIVPRK
jgi:hypothetical protein